MNEPKIFVGTMHCGEGDFTHCVEAITKQFGVRVKHVVISDLAEKEAHNLLWKSWRDERSNFDMFVKVDADTTLSHDKVLLELWNLMQSNHRITGIQAPLHDYFTDGHINGLNCFSPKVTFRDTADELFCDRQVDVDHDVVIKSESVPNVLRPAGYHCYHTTDAQAFHFGVHRALKKQVHIIDSIQRVWELNNDRPRALALIGATYAPMFQAGGFNYNDKRFQDVLVGVLNRYEDLVTTL